METIHEESVKLHMNEVAMEYRYEAEEAKQLAEKEKQNALQAQNLLEKQNVLDVQNKLELEKQKALDEKKKINQARELNTILIHTLSKTMSKEEIAKLLNISIDELNAY